MRYEDASHTGFSTAQASDIEARDDTDTLAAGQRSAATGNVIDGSGTDTGATGADQNAADARIVEVAGSQGADSSFAGGRLSANGQFGQLTIDADGNYRYVANEGTPENSRDRFVYTLADNEGHRDSAAITFEIGKTQVKIQANAQQVVVGPDGVVVLPAGVQLSDVHVVGRNLVIDLPDGSQMIIIDGAVFVPQLVLDGVEVPATNLAALLVSSEPRPAAGETPPSSGINSEVPVPPLDPGVPLGDLIPPTEMVYVPPEIREEGQFIDREPEAGAASNVLDDDAQAGGNPLSTIGDDPGSNIATGSLPGSGGDGSLEWALLASGSLPAGLGFSFAGQPNGDVWILQGGVHVITVHVDPTNGNYTVTQIAAIDHTAGGNENNEIFVINYSVTDDDGDVAIGTLTIDVDDDMPTVTVQAGPDANVILTTDDAQTIGAASDSDVTSANFSGVFGGTSVVFGADGAGPGSSSTYALAVTSSNSGLTSHGAAINLFVVGGVVVGTTAGSAPANLSDPAIVFTVSTTNTGVVTLTQFQQIDHAPENPSGSPFNDQFTSMVDGLVTLTRSETAVDGDGDQVTGSASVNIGANLHFTDDGPTIGLATVGEPSLTVDESDLATNSTQSFAANFTAAFGADGPAASGSITYALGVSSPGVASGLVDIASLQPIVLVLNGGVVEGHVGTATGALAFTVSVDAAGNVTLDQLRAVQHTPDSGPDQSTTLSADALVTLTATAHDFDGDTATATINIGTNLNFEDDAPTIDVTVNGGVTEPVLLTQDTETDGTPTTQDSASSTANFGGVFGLSFTTGADGAPTPTLNYSLGAVAGASGLTQGGAAINLYLIGGVVVGSTSATQGGVNAGNTVFNVSVDASGVVTLTQFSQIDHPIGSDPTATGSPFADHIVSLVDSKVTLTASSTITDNDGDQATDSATVNIGANLQFADDGPDISAVLTGTQIRIDETDGVVAVGGEVDPVGGNLGTVTVAAATLFTVSNVNLSADTQTTLGYGLVLSSQGVASGLLLSTTNAPIFLYNIGGVVTGSTSATLGGVNAGNTAFTVSIDAGTGAVTMTQFLAVEHGNTSSFDEDSSGLAAGVLQVQVTATDFDGDTDAANVDLGSVIRFEDDGPSIDVTKGSDANVSLTTDDADTIAGATDTTSTSANFGGVFGLTSNGGSDGAASAPTLGFQLGVSAPGVDSGLDQGGSSIFLYLIGGKVVGSTSATQGGVTAGNTVFDVSVNGSGVVTLTQYSQIDHPIGGDPSATGAPFADHILSMADGLVTLTASSTITDNDGDQATDSETVSIGANLHFTDDGPDVSSVLTGALLKIDETDGVGVGAEVDPVGGNLGTVTVAAATLFTVSQPHASADSPTTLAYSLALSAPGVDSGLDVSSNNASIFLYNISGTVVGSTAATIGAVNAGNTAFTVSIDAGTGAVTMTQFLAIEHPTPGASHDEDSLGIAAGALSAVVTATDFDGDTDVASVDLGSVIRFEDDGPSAQPDVDSIVGGNGPATGNVLTGVEVAIPEDGNLTDGVADNVGSDTPGSITFIDHSNAAPGVAVPAGGSVNILGDHGTLTIYSNGDYSYLRTDAAGGVSDVFTYTLTDADGDTVTSTLTIGIQDNFPVLPDPAAILLDDDVIPAAGGNLDGPGDDNPDTVPGNVVNGTLVGSGGDAPLTYNFTGVNTLPTGFTIGAGSDSDTLLINQGGTLVMTIQLNQSTGAFTVTQNAPMLHDPTNPGAGGGQASNFEDNLDFLIGVNVEDADHDVEPATITIHVDDDTPTIDVTKGADAGVVLLTQDADTIGGATDTAVSTANFSGVFGLTQSAGADGTNAAATLGFMLDVTGYAGGPGGIDSGLDQGGANIFLYEIGGKVVGSTSATLAGVSAGNTVFDVGVSGTGVVTLTQYSQIDHPLAGDPTPTGTPFADHIVSMVDTLVTLTASATLTDKDGDTVTDSETANIGANLQFADDGPTAAIVTTGQTVSLDESAGNQIDSKDVTGPIAAFAGVLNPGDDLDVAGTGPIQFATNASALVASTGSAYGADGAGTTLFGLSVAPGGVDSGLDTTAGVNIFLFLENGLVVGRVGATAGVAAAGPAAFALAIDTTTGAVSMVEYLSINHPNAGNPDDSVSIINTAVQATVTVTDGDGDTATNSVNIGSLISFQDSGPIMTAAQNMNIQNSGDFAHTAAFAFNLGADGANASNDVITNVTGSATVGGVAVTNWVLTPGAENATTASYSFSFDYPTGVGVTAHETGTLVFDKVAGTYTVDLANAIQGVTTILQTSQGTLFQGYEFGTSTPDGSQPAISVTQIQDLAGTANDIYVQFTAVSEPSSGTGNDNLEVTNWVPGANNPAPINNPPDPTGGDSAWNAGQLFNQVDGWVSTSNSANGVDGDTIQGGEVLDFTLVQGANPTGNLAQPATFAQASAMFLTFDGIGAGEDMIVILKLYDPNTNMYTTRAIMVENSDIFKGPADNDPNTAAPALPAPYSSITLDNNDGFVAIESNDYNNPGENWVIVGAQIAGSDEGVTGTAINLNAVTGAAGDSDTANDGSLDTDAAGFQSDTNDGPFKISSIGFLTTQTTPQNAQLDFNVTVTDGDGDSITQAITATVTAAADSTSAATIPAANTTVAPVVLDLNGDGVQFLGGDAGVHYNYGHGSVATAWVGPNDGILVHDANGNGTVDGAGEFVFGSGGQTDMQALAAQYGSALNAGDADYAKFGVWQDANSNGVVDAGEYQTLSEAGIASIGLVSDGVGYSSAGGDVQVAGSSTYTGTDGSTGIVADASFSTGSLADEQRALNTSTSNIALAAAVAAAGLAAPQAVAAADLPDAAGHGQDVAAVATAVGASVTDLTSDAGEGSRSLLANEVREAVDEVAEAASSGHGSSSSDAGEGLDVAALRTPSNDDGAASVADSGPSQSALFGGSQIAPDVAMPDGATLQAAGLANNAQKAGVVEKVLADALGHDAAPTVDGLLAALGGGKGLGALASIEHSASPAHAGVPGWDMAANGSSGPGADVMFKVDATLHHDMVQPAVNG